MDIFKLIGGLSASRLRNFRDDDTQADRLNHRYTTTICVVFAIIVSTKQYVGDPIDCWVPAQFKPSYEKYADSYCWMKNTYFFSQKEELPSDENLRKSNEIIYYQWVPFILCLQAFFFYFPRIVWRTGNAHFGINIVALVDAAVKYECMENFESKTKILNYICFMFDRFISIKNVQDYRLKRPVDDFVLWYIIKTVFCTHIHSCIINLYILAKLLWLVNVTVQLIALNYIFGNVTRFYGVELLLEFLKYRNATESKHFPKVTYCDFSIREVGFTHHYTVQCVLKINLFNEVIFTFLWFWLLIVFVITFYDLTMWIYKLLPGQKYCYVKNRLMTGNSLISNPDKDRLKCFSKTYLTSDVVFALRLLEANTNDFMISEILTELWKHYRACNKSSLAKNESVLYNSTNISPNTKVLIGLFKGQSL